MNYLNKQIKISITTVEFNGLLTLTEIEYHIRAEDISKNTTWCILCSHGWFSQAWSHMSKHLRYCKFGKVLPS